MNNPLENILRDQKQRQRTFGITENLLEKPVPRFYGAGDHKVQLAYITPDEAKLLADLDLHDSSPPNPGPGGIPNFNDPGTGMSGTQTSAAEKNERDRTKQERADLAAGPSFGDKFPGGNNQNQNTTTTPTTKDEGSFGNFLSNLFTPPTAKEQFINKIGFNPKLNKFIKQTYGVNSINDLTDEQVQAINDYNNVSFNELRDLVSNLTGKVIDDPLAAGYNTLMGTSLGPQGIGNLGIVSSLANIAMGTPAYSSVPSNFAFTGPMVDEQGNLISQDFSYTGPMSTNPVVNQKIADLQSINGVTGALTAAQQAEAVAKAVSGSQTGNPMFSFGGDGEGNRPIQQNTVQDTIQSQMDSLTDSELSRYNQLIEQGYSDEYAKAYIGML